MINYILLRTKVIRFGNEYLNRAFSELDEGVGDSGGGRMDSSLLLKYNPAY